MKRQVRGILFLDYVRMIRGHKGVDWTRLLAPEDLHYLIAKINPDAWYPMTTFERMGDAILKEVAGGDFEAVRLWGRLSVETLIKAHPTLLAKADPIETLMRFRVHRSTYFDFDTLAIPTLTIDHASVIVRYGMGKTAEEAASYQTMGFFEGLLLAAGANEVNARFASRSWSCDPETLIEIDWTS